MKNLLIILLPLSLIIACSDDDAVAKNSVSQTKNNTSKTISKKEVARIAIVQTQQLMDSAQKIGSPKLKKAKQIFDLSKTMYKKGDYKQSQKLAVKSMHLIKKAVPRL